MKHIYYFYFFKHDKKIKFLFLLDIIFFLTKSYAKNNILLKKCIKYYSFINHLFILEKNKKAVKKELIKKLNNEIKKINFVKKYHNFSSKSEKLFFYDQINKRKKQINNIKKNKEEEDKDNKLKIFIKKKNFYLKINLKILELISKLKINNNIHNIIKGTKKKYIRKYLLRLNNQFKRRIMNIKNKIHNRKKELIFLKKLKHQKLKNTRKLVKKLAILFITRLKSIGQFFFNQVPTILIHEKSRKKVGVLFNNCFKYVFKAMNKKYSKYSFFYIFIKHLKRSINPYLNKYSLMHGNDFLLEIISFFLFSTSDKSINDLLKKDISNNKKTLSNNINFIYKFVYKYYFRLDFFLKKFFSDLDMLRYNISFKGILINGFLVKDYTIYLKLNDLINLSPISKFANFNKYYNDLIININSLFFFINNNCHYPFFKIKKLIYNALFLVLKNYIKYKKTNYYVRGKLIYFTNKVFDLKRDILKYSNLNKDSESLLLPYDNKFLRTKYIPNKIQNRYHKNKKIYFFQNFDRYGDYITMYINRELKKTHKNDLYEDANIVRENNINDKISNKENIKYRYDFFLNRFGFSAKKICFTNNTKLNFINNKINLENNRFEHLLKKNYDFLYNDLKYYITNLLKTSLFYNFNKLKLPKLKHNYNYKRKHIKNNKFFYGRKKFSHAIVNLLLSKKGSDNNFQKMKSYLLGDFSFNKIRKLIIKNYSILKSFDKYKKIRKNSIYEESDYHLREEFVQKNNKLNKRLSNYSYDNKNYNKFYNEHRSKYRNRYYNKYYNKGYNKFNKKKLDYNNILLKRQKKLFYELFQKIKLKLEPTIIFNFKAELLSNLALRKYHLYIDNHKRVINNIKRYNTLNGSLSINIIKPFFSNKILNNVNNLDNYYSFQDIHMNVKNKYKIMYLIIFLKLYNIFYTFNRYYFYMYKNNFLFNKEILIKEKDNIKVLINKLISLFI
jgi:hypothetical protein